MLSHPSSCRHDHRLLLLDQFSVLAVSSPTSDDGSRHRGKLPLLALPVRILSSRRGSGTTGTHHVPEALPVFRLQQDEEDGVEQHGDVHHAVEGHLCFDGWTHRHASVLVASVSKLASIHLHQLVDVVRGPGANEEEDEEDHDDGGPVVREVQAGRPRATQLHEECQQREHEDNPGEYEGHDQEGEVYVVLRAAGVHEPEVENSALATVHGGHGSWCDGHPHPQHPGQGDGPLVHLGPPGVNLSTLRGVGLILPVPEIQKQRSEDQQKCVNSFYCKIHKQVEFAQKLR